MASENVDVVSDLVLFFEFWSYFNQINGPICSRHMKAPSVNLAPIICGIEASKLQISGPPKIAVLQGLIGCIAGIAPVPKISLENFFLIF